MSRRRRGGLTPPPTPPPEGEGAIQQGAIANKGGTAGAFETPPSLSGAGVFCCPRLPGLRRFRGHDRHQPGSWIDAQCCRVEPRELATLDRVPLILTSRTDEGIISHR